jgi:hypothetical protein
VSVTMCSRSPPGTSAWVAGAVVGGLADGGGDCSCCRAASRSICHSRRPPTSGRAVRGSGCSSETPSKDVTSRSLRRTTFSGSPCITQCARGSASNAADHGTVAALLPEATEVADVAAKVEPQLRELTSTGSPIHGERDRNDCRDVLVAGRGIEDPLAAHVGRVARLDLEDAQLHARSIPWRRVGR